MTLASSLIMVPVIEAEPNAIPAEGSDSVTVKLSSDSTVVSPATAIWNACSVSPAAKVTKPEMAPVKSAASAGAATKPASVQLSVCAVDTALLRDT